jgi:hypothetical protein
MKRTRNTIGATIPIRKEVVMRVSIIPENSHAVAFMLRIPNGCKTPPSIPKTAGAMIIATSP